MQLFQGHPLTVSRSVSEKVSKPSINTFNVSVSMSHNFKVIHNQGHIVPRSSNQCQLSRSFIIKVTLCQCYPLMSVSRFIPAVFVSRSSVKVSFKVINHQMSRQVSRLPTIKVTKPEVSIRFYLSNSLVSGLQWLIRLKQYNC